MQGESLGLPVHRSVVTRRFASPCISLHASPGLNGFQAMRKDLLSGFSITQDTAYQRNNHLATEARWNIATGSRVYKMLPVGTGIDDEKTMFGYS
jgi:hypothetical protein